jgi:hypothetical protein
VQGENCNQKTSDLVAEILEILQENVRLLTTLLVLTISSELTIKSYLSIK